MDRENTPEASLTSLAIDSLRKSHETIGEMKTEHENFKNSQQEIKFSQQEIKREMQDVKDKLTKLNTSVDWIKWILMVGSPALVMLLIGLLLNH